MDINYVLIGLRIHQKRKEERLTQEQLAEKVEISTGYLSMIERGDKQASLPVLCNLADALSLSLDETVFGNLKAIQKNGPEWEKILADCSGSEKEVIMETVNTLKKMLIQNRRSSW